MSTLPKIIAVDFDGTLFENAWPDVGAPIEKNINKLKAEQADGAKVILWTNRVGGALDKAVNFCKEHGIHLDAVNENLPEIVQGFGTDCRKIFANEYWDDHAVWMSKQDIGEFSDGFHTFNSLYHQRLILFAALVNTFPSLAWKSRRNHKLDEWHTFCDWIESLPYSELITGKGNSAPENSYCSGRR